MEEEMITVPVVGKIHFTVGEMPPPAVDVNRDLFRKARLKRFAHRQVYAPGRQLVGCEADAVFDVDYAVAADDGGKARIGGQSAFAHLFVKRIRYLTDGVVEGDAAVQRDPPAWDDYFTLQIDERGRNKITRHADGINDAAMRVKGKQVWFLAAFLRRNAFSRVGDHAFIQVMIDYFVNSHFAETGGA